MTVILPEDYHAQKALESNNVTCIRKDDALRQDIRPLRIGILNIMPKAQTYEFNLLYALGKSILQIDPVWIKLNTHSYKSSNQAHMHNLYVSFEEAISEKHLDGLILTGAPVEALHFKEVKYWKEIQRILSYARKNIPSTLGICWGGMALAYMLGIEKLKFDTKLFGVYKVKNLNRNHPVTGDLDDFFQCPQSRHAGYDDRTMEKAAHEGKIRLLGYSPEASYTIFDTPDGRFISHLGHPEYNSGRIIEEAVRDKERGRTDVGEPVNFDIENPVNNWRSHRNEFFSQWIKYIYTETSY